MTRRAFDDLCLSLGMTADGPHRYRKGSVCADFLGRGWAVVSYARVLYARFHLSWRGARRGSAERLREDLQGWVRDGV
jgi:hypothetical protein